MKEKKEKKAKKRKDIRKLKTIPAMDTIVPFIMKRRNGSTNLMYDKINLTPLEKYIREKQLEGKKNLSAMHVLIAAYCRTVSQRPALNRFIRGQRAYTRHSIDVSLTIKREFRIDSPDTVVKITLEPDATIDDVYEKLNHEITSYRANPTSDMDDAVGFLRHIPALLLRGIIGFLNFLDYFGLIPKSLIKISPFHASLFITSMGSLGIPAIYHHLYDFGTCPIFIAFGEKRRRYEVNPDGTVYKHRFMDVKLTVDERICDGFYYASSFKLFKQILANPGQLDNPPEKVVEDIR